MKPYPTGLTAQETERWAYAQGDAPIAVFAAQLSDLEWEVEGLQDENEKQFNEIQELGEQIEQGT